MNEIDRYLDQACHNVSGPVSLRKHLRAELKEHLEEAIKELVTRGMSEDEATRKVLDDFGEPELVREGLQSVYGHSVTSFFVDKAMQWKENTMKSKWTWNIMVQFGLLLVIAAAISCSVFILLWIVPRVTQMYHEIGERYPLDGFKDAIRISRHLWDWWWAWLGAIVIVVGLFEWKCKSENKAMIRAAMGVGASILSVGFAFFLAISTMVMLAMLPYDRSHNWDESFIASKVASAERSYQRLVHAVEKQNWPVARDALRDMEKDYEVIEDWKTIAIMLPSETQCDGVKEIRRLIFDVNNKSTELDIAIYRYEGPAVIQKRYAELQNAYSQLKKKSKFFATHTAPETDQQTDEKKPAETDMAVPDAGPKME